MHNKKRGNHLSTGSAFLSISCQNDLVPRAQTCHQLQSVNRQPIPFQFTHRIDTVAHVQNTSSLSRYSLTVSMPIVKCGSINESLCVYEISNTLYSLLTRSTLSEILYRAKAIFTRTLSKPWIWSFHQAWWICAWAFRYFAGYTYDSTLEWITWCGSCWYRMWWSSCSRIYDWRILLIGYMAWNHDQDLLYSFHSQWTLGITCITIQGTGLSDIVYYECTS